ncbi:MAG: hypothetical protein P1V36_17150, partial [Planctomycetota bacterium]|nr:hypothetical protein [Planctomycetota bacterium]
MTAGRKYSLRFTIASLVVVLLLATVAGVLVIAFFIRARTIADTAQSLQSEVSTRITERVVERFAPIPGMLRGLEASVTRGGALPPEEEMLERLVDRMRYETRIEWLAWVAADASGVGALTHPEGVLAVRLQPGGMAQAEVRHADGSRTAAPALDLRSIQDAPWIKTAHATEGTVWSEIYKRPLDGQLGRACVLAVRREEQVLGVLGVGFSGSVLRSSLNSLRVGETGAVFALGPDGAIRTSPSDAALARLGPAGEAAVRRLDGGRAGLDPG